MNILIACEESQTICKAMRERGHRAFSCDILPCSGNHEEWHIQEDCIPLLNGHCEFTLQNGQTDRQTDRWDLLIAHPPCTYLTVTGNRWFNAERYGEKAIQRLKDREAAAEFFMKFVYADCDRIAIENPIGYMSTYYKKPTQIIQPYFFGDKARKATCLWLKGLQPLQPTNIVTPEIIVYKNGRGTDNAWHMETMKLPKEERARARSKTFEGVAQAIAAQWG